VLAYGFSVGRAASLVILFLLVRLRGDTLYGMGNAVPDPYTQEKEIWMQIN
jgi:hypothetical protein